MLVWPFANMWFFGFVFEYGVCVTALFWLGGKGWTNMTSLTPPLDVELPVPGYENKMSCVEEV